METVSNVVSSASKMIWGDSAAKNETEGQEPVSGQTGEGTADKPYDKGNEIGLPTTVVAAPIEGAVDTASRSVEEPSSATKLTTAFTGSPSDNSASIVEAITPKHPNHPDAGDKDHVDFSPVTKPIPGPDRTTSSEGVSKSYVPPATESAELETDTSLVGAERRTKEGQQLTDAKREDLISKDQRGASATDAIPATAKLTTTPSPASALVPAAASTPSPSSSAKTSTPSPAPSAKASSTASPKSDRTDKKVSKMDKLMGKLHIHKKHGEGGGEKSA